MAMARTKQTSKQSNYGSKGANHHRLLNPPPAEPQTKKRKAPSDNSSEEESVDREDLERRFKERTAIIASQHYLVSIGQLKLPFVPLQVEQSSKKQRKKVDPRHMCQHEFGTSHRCKIKPSNFCHQCSIYQTDELIVDWTKELDLKLYCFEHFSVHLCKEVNTSYSQIHS